MRYYGGIGSRKTPRHILDKMFQIAHLLAGKGYILRSGGADGADAAFEAGARQYAIKHSCDYSKIMEIYLPWKGFNGCPDISGYDSKGPTPEAFDIAAKFHPNWQQCSLGAKKLHARNSHQVLGKDLHSPSKFIICWHQNTGGTMQAVRIATAHKIPILNLASQVDHSQSLDFVLEWIRSVGLSEKE